MTINGDYMKTTQNNRAQNTESIETSPTNKGTAQENHIDVMARPSRWSRCVFVWVWVRVFIRVRVKCGFANNGRKSSVGFLPFEN
mgnify:CR=1 FL=1